MYTRPVEPMRSVASSRGGSHGKSATQKGGRFQPQARGADGDRVSPRCQPRLEPCRLMPPLWPVALKGRPALPSPLLRMFRRAKDFCCARSSFIRSVD